MSRKKGFLGKLFSGKQSGGCCNMEITEEPVKKSGCCDMQIIEEREREENVTDDSSSSVIVLGTGCANCKMLQANVEAAVEKLGLEVEVKHISDVQKIMEYQVMSVPALVLNQKVVSVGRVLKTEDIVKLLKETF